jgi:uptake hydrogenase small subunit
MAGRCPCVTSPRGPASGWSCRWPGVRHDDDALAAGGGLRGLHHVAALCAESPGVVEMLEDAGIRMLWHPALSVETGAEVVGLLEDVAEGRVPLDILCVEGAIARGPGGTGRFQMLSGTRGSLMHWVERIAPARACGGGGDLRGLWRRDGGGGQPVGRGGAAV